VVTTTKVHEPKIPIISVREPIGKILSCTWKLKRTDKLSRTPSKLFSDYLGSLILFGREGLGH
jgi:hypothetical protein